jgi:hypothetical protein
MDDHDTLQYFAFGHLRGDLQDTSRRFHDLAEWIVDELPAGGQRSVALQKLLEAKDAAVRAALSKG